MGNTPSTDPAVSAYERDVAKYYQEARLRRIKYIYSLPAVNETCKVDNEKIFGEQYFASLRRTLSPHTTDMKKKTVIELNNILMNF
jgi:hypothetical protein